MVRLAAGCYSTAFPRRGICNRKSFLCNVSDEKDKNAVLPVASHFFFHQRFFFLQYYNDCDLTTHFSSWS